tara:strand:- start:8368 stop:9597 length:1230 start_codon:yes stop_codon:yes gene_type:complete
MTNKIKEIYDVSFIKIKTNINNNFDMQGNNLYQVNKLIFTDNDKFIKYIDNDLFTIDSNNISTNIYTLTANLIEANYINLHFNYINVNFLSINSVTCDTIKSNNIILNNDSDNPSSFDEPLTFNTYKGNIANTIDASVNTFYSQNFKSNQFNINNALNIYNNPINLNSDNSFNIFKINNNTNQINILSYLENKSIAIDYPDNNGNSNLTSSVIYGKVKCHTIFLNSYTSYGDILINPLAFERTIVDNVTVDNSYSDLLLGNYFTLNTESFGDRGFDTTIKSTLGKAFFGNMIVNYLTSGSDDRLKHNEEPIVNGLNIVNKLKPKTYIKRNNIFDDDNIVFKRCSGYIAQDISNDIPEISHVINRSGNILSVSYNEIQPYITKSIQELDTICNNIQNKTINLLQQVHLLI